jgi:hypothetical protein
MRRALSSGATVRPKAPTGAQCCFHRPIEDFHLVVASNGTKPSNRSAGLSVEEGIPFVAPLGSHGGSAEWEAFNPLDDLIIEHEASVTDRGAAVFDHGRSNQG